MYIRSCFGLACIYVYPQLFGFRVPVCNRIAQCFFGAMSTFDLETEMDVERLRKFAKALVQRHKELEVTNKELEGKYEKLEKKCICQGKYKELDGTNKEIDGTNPEPIPKRKKYSADQVEADQVPAAHRPHGREGHEAQARRRRGRTSVTPR